MKLGRFYVLFVLFILVGWNSVFAQSVTFSDLRLEHNVPDENGRKMLQFHYSMTVMGCQGHDVRVIMWVDIPQGVTHYYANGNKMTTQSGNLHCSWETTNFNNGMLAIYNDQLNPRPGKNTYYTRLGVWDETLKRYIGWSDFLSFENTGSEKSVASSVGPAPKATLNNCYVTHQGYNILVGFYPDKTSNQSGMTFHLNLNIKEGKEKDFWCIVELAYYNGDDSYYFSHAKGEYEYNGHLAVYKKIKSPYDSSTWDDLQLFLPHSEITEAVGKGKDWSSEQIFYCVTVQDMQGLVLLKEWQKSPLIKFYQTYNKPQDCTTCWGRQVCMQCGGRGISWLVNQYVTCFDCKGTGKCRYCGKGGWSEPGVLNTRNSFNIIENQMSSPFYNQPIINQPIPPTYTREKIECVDCNGSGKCTWCAGRGEYRNQYSGMMDDCRKCNGGGVCPTCHGRKYK